MAAISERGITPTEMDQRLASELSSLLDSYAALNHEVKVQFLDESAPSAIMSMPVPAVRLLGQILREMAKGNTLTLIPTHAMLTTQEAADLLNVSRPFLVGLLESGKIPYQRLGSHRRILFQDLMAFKDKTDAAREDALRELTEEAQALGLGY